MGFLEMYKCVYTCSSVYIHMGVYVWHTPAGFAIRPWPQHSTSNPTTEEACCCVTFASRRHAFFTKGSLKGLPLGSTLLLKGNVRCLI